MLLKRLAFILFAATAFGQNINLTAVHRTMEHGVQVPPLTWVQDAYVTGCTGNPVLSTTATTASAVGTYPITMGAGDFACPGRTFTLIDGTIDVIAATGKGAQIVDQVAYPPGFTGGPNDPAADITNNTICNVVPNSAAAQTANTTCINLILAHYMNTNCSTQPTLVSYLYVPDGKYWFDGQINPCGNGWTFFGTGPQRAIFYLAPNSAAFNTGTAIQFFNPSSVGANANFREFVYNIGIEIGYGNPNAIPYTSVMNNAGAIRNSIIWADDSNCPYALNFRRAIPGPAYARDLAIYGCVNAVSSNQIEYLETLDQFTTEGQTGTVIDGGNLHYSIQHWLNDNPGTALNLIASGEAAILDSTLLNGSGVGVAVASGGSIYVRDTTFGGYSPSIADTGTGALVNTTGNVTEYWTGTASCLFCGTPGSLRLPQQETPNPTDDPTPANWTVLTSPSSGWPAIIAASTSTTVYAPPGNYTSSGTINITVPDTVNHLNFYNSLCQAGCSAAFNITIAGTSGTPLVIDGCVYAVCRIIHTGTRAVVIRDTYYVSYTPSLGAGNVFFDDVSQANAGSLIPLVFPAAQNIWARQLNVELHHVPNIVCDGCIMWTLGYKNEASPNAGPAFVLQNGAKMEVFGHFLFPLEETASRIAPANYISSSSLWDAPIFEFVQTTPRGFANWFQETKNNLTLSLATPSQNVGNYVLHGYYATAPAAPASLDGNGVLQ